MPTNLHDISTLFTSYYNQLQDFNFARLLETYSSTPWYIYNAYVLQWGPWNTDVRGK